jgi:hypothetical protein
VQPLFLQLESNVSEMSVVRRKKAALHKDWRAGIVQAKLSPPEADEIRQLLRRTNRCKNMGKRAKITVDKTVKVKLKYMINPAPNILPGKFLK